MSFITRTFKSDEKYLVKYLSDYVILLLPQTILYLSKIYLYKWKLVLVFSANMMVTSGPDGIKVLIYTCNRSVNWCSGEFLTTFNCSVRSRASLIRMLCSIELSRKSIWKVGSVLRQHITLYFLEECREQDCTTASFKILAFSSLIIVFLCHSALLFSEYITWELIFYLFLDFGAGLVENIATVNIAGSRRYQR
jgi:hypothetical protein